MVQHGFLLCSDDLSLKGKNLLKKNLQTLKIYKKGMPNNLQKEILEKISVDAEN